MSDPDLVPLDERLCFALYSTGQAIIAKYKTQLSVLGMTYPQYLVYVELDAVEAMSVKQLGHRLHLDSGTLSPLLKRMEGASLIQRERDQDDERRVLVSLTSRARKLRTKIAQIQLDVSCATGLKPVEFKKLLTDLQALNTRLRVD